MYVITIVTIDRAPRSDPLAASSLVSGFQGRRGRSRSIGGGVGLRRGGFVRFLRCLPGLLDASPLLLLLRGRIRLSATGEGREEDG
jgi:hypothetical protein